MRITFQVFTVELQRFSAISRERGKICEHLPDVFGIYRSAYRESDRMRHHCKRNKIALDRLLLSFKIFNPSLGRTLPVLRQTIFFDVNPTKFMHRAQQKIPVSLGYKSPYFL